VWAGYAANHYRLSPEPSAATATPIAEPVQQPMPPTNCPKLRRMRELLAEEAAAKGQNDSVQRQAAAIQAWHDTPTKKGNEAFFQLAVDLRSAGLSTVEIEDVLRLETGNARHPAERRREIKRIIRGCSVDSRLADLRRATNSRPDATITFSMHGLVASGSSRTQCGTATLASVWLHDAHLTSPTAGLETPAPCARS
jgi:hypothetical protein